MEYGAPDGDGDSCGACRRLRLHNEVLGSEDPVPLDAFPQVLKFDFTGIPITLALLLYGLSSAATTSSVACLAIIARSGDVVGALMKAIAEFSTVLGMRLGLHVTGRYSRIVSVFVGVALRIAAMSITNLVVLPTYYGMPFSVAFNLLPMLGAFNAIQGALTSTRLW